MWEDLDAPALAAVVSTCVYAGRREDRGEPDVPGGPHGTLARALEATTRVWSEVDDLEEAHDIDATGALDEGLVTAVHRWAVGRSLDAVLRGSEIAAGDFVRWCKQVIDVLDQVATAAPTPAVRRTAHQAIEAAARRRRVLERLSRPRPHRREPARARDVRDTRRHLRGRRAGTARFGRLWRYREGLWPQPCTAAA